MIGVKHEVVLALTLLAASLFSILPPLAGAAEGGLRLELASVVFRHGDRSPVHNFPNDTYKESDWPQGYGQLSKVGMQQQFHLGELLKARYVIDNGCTGLICSNYTRVQVRVRSTDYDRTLMSVESQLAALFPPAPNKSFDASLLWQPIPVHTLPKTEDKLIDMPPGWGVCPTYDDLRAKDFDLPQYKKMEAKYKDFVAFVGKQAGVENLTFGGVNGLHDTIFIENVSDGYHPPNWVNESVLDTMTLISDYTMSLLFNTKQKSRLNAGIWLEKVLFNMKSKSNPNGNQAVEDMNLFLYSAHDTTVAAMTSALQVFNNKQPGYATAFAVELYSNANKTFFVKLFRRDGPNSENFELLNVTYCKDSGMCTLEEFESFVTPLIPDDLALECGNTPTTQSPDMNKQQPLEVIVITLGCILCVALAIIIIIAVVALASNLRKRRRSHRIFSALIQETDS